MFKTGKLIIGQTSFEQKKNNWINCWKQKYAVATTSEQKRVIKDEDSWAAPLGSENYPCGWAANYEDTETFAFLFFEFYCYFSS